MACETGNSYHRLNISVNHYKIEIWNWDIVMQLEDQDHKGNNSAMKLVEDMFSWFIKESVKQMVDRLKIWYRHFSKICFVFHFEKNNHFHIQYKKQIILWLWYLESEVINLILLLWNEIIWDISILNYLFQNSRLILLER